MKAMVMRLYGFELEGEGEFRIEPDHTVAENRYLVHCSDDESDKPFPALLAPLPTLVELHRKLDDQGNLRKQANVAQVLHVFRSEEDLNQSQAKVLTSGLTPPMQNIVQKRAKCAPTTKPPSVDEVSAIVKDMNLSFPRVTMEYDFVDQKPWMEEDKEYVLDHAHFDTDDARHILKHPDSFFSISVQNVVETEEKVEDCSWYVDTDDEVDDDEHGNTET